MHEQNADYWWNAMVRRPSFNSGGLPYGAVADHKLPMPSFQKGRPSFDI